jgi:hypothetical protein
METTMNLHMKLASILLCTTMATEAAAQTANVPTLEPVMVDVDISGLPSSEQAALVPLLRAARDMDELYIQQVWPGSRKLITERQSSPTPAAQAEFDALNFFKGPWGRTGTAFIGGVPAERPIGDFYPPDTTKHDIEVWLKRLPELDRKRALDSFTVIERGRTHPFEIVPYGSHYRDVLSNAAKNLREAAALTHDKTLRSYLTLRADALLNDDYYASDVAFVGLKGSIDVVLGPYEVDDDAWFGTKTAFESSIALVNQPATRRIAQISKHLQELEDNLPMPAELRGRKLGAAAPIVVSDAIYQGGMAAAGNAAAGYGLPNDLRVLNAVGGRTGTYSNILKLRYGSTFLPIAEATLSTADQSTLRFEDIRDEVMFVRIFDALGPQVVAGTKQSIADALRENAGVANQIRSMLLSLWGHRYLIEHGYLDRRESASLYSAFLIPALARIRDGSTGTPARGSTFVLNHLLESGAITVGDDGRFSINQAAADACIVQAAKEFVLPMAKGDDAMIGTLLKRYAAVRPEIGNVLKRLGSVPPLERPVYRTADRLSPPTIIHRHAG